MSLDYLEVGNFYKSIYDEIFKEIDILHPNVYEGMVVKYSDEYLRAYSYLHRVCWILEDNALMEKYFDEENFKYFGLENLYEVRSKISNYLRNNNVEFKDYVYEYKKFDYLFDDYVGERFSEKSNKYFAYYEKKLLQQNDYDMMLNSLIMLSDDTKKIINGVKESKYIKNLHNKKLNKINKMIKELVSDVKDDM